MFFSKYITAAILLSAGTYSQSAPGPIQDGQSINCDRWHLVDSGENCQSIVDGTIDITLDEFLSWNHGVGVNCSTLLVGFYACTRAPPAPLASVQPGQPASCNRWDLVAAGESCQIIVDRHADITLAQFLAWNPGAGQNCTTLWGDYYACTGAPDGAPIQVQPGQAIDCNSWDLVNSGDTCQTIADKHPGLSLAQVIAWNAGAGEDCSKLWPEYYACSGVSPPSGNRTSTSSSASPRTPGPTPLR